jgi:hypothetical protein
MKMHNETGLERLFHPEKYPGLLVRDLAERTILLWRNNSLGNFCSWSIFSDTSTCYLRRIIWEQYTQFKLIDPSTYGAEVIISKQLSNKILTGFYNNLIEMNDYMNRLKSALVIDGIYYGVITPTERLKWLGGTVGENENLHKGCLDAILQLEEFLFNHDNE